MLLGWMNNWAYATQTPTDPWRSAMTLPRTLHLAATVDGSLEVIQHLVVPSEIRTLELGDGAADGSSESTMLDAEEPFRVRGTLSALDPQQLVLRFADGSSQAQTLVLSMDAQGRVVLDRSAAHAAPFAPDHSLSHPYAPRVPSDRVSYDLIVDRSCIDLELDGGRAVVSQQIFPGGSEVTVSLEPAE